MNTVKNRGNRGYQIRDHEICDYQLHKQFGLEWRGPATEPAESRQYLACIGAAQTFGCFCNRPFPDILSKKLQIDVLNYGYAGAGPSFFMHNEALLERLNGARCVIVQVMSGRSVDNSLFESGGLEYLTERASGRRMGARQAYSQLLRKNFLFGRKNLRHIVAETRENWIADYRRLFSLIEVPTILLWFSRRRLQYREHYLIPRTMLGKFPHLVNQEMIDRIRPFAPQYVECRSRKGSPQRLISRHTGLPAEVDPGSNRTDLGGPRWRYNSYYPSPEMHEDVADKLLAPAQVHLRM